MAINVNILEADALTRLGVETPRQTAARLRTKHGVTLDETATPPLPKQAFDEMWGEP